MLFPRRNNGGQTPTGGLTGTDAASGHVAATTTVFDGKTDKTFKFEQHAELTNYTIDLRLISAEFPSVPSTYTETTPSMPFRIGQNITCQTEPGGYALSLREDGKEVLKPFIWATAGATRITMVSDSVSFVVYGNGAEVARLPKALRLGIDARLGAGFLKRFWAGEMEHFDVYSVVKLKSAFDASAGRLSTTGRIASLST